MNTTKMTNRFAERVNHVPVSFIREILKAASKPGIISFAGGLPNPDLFPVKEIQEAAQHVLQTDGKNALQYSVTEGYYPLRKFISERYKHRKGLDIPPENILITNGSQQALDLIGKAFIDPGDHVLLERPSYLGAIQCLSMFQPQLSDISLENDGINMEEFKNALKEKDIKLFYCIPNFQNPTGVSYSLQKRKEIAEEIRKYNTMLIEDDPYGDICFGETAPDNIRKYNQEQVILLGSFSKTVSPGMRLGWVAAEPEIIETLTRMKQASDLHSNYLSQRIMYQFLTDHDPDVHIRKICLEYSKQKNTMMDMIRKYFPANITYAEPQGGMFLWLTLPSSVDSRDVLAESIKEKVIFVPGDTFYFSQGNKNTIRMNFSNLNQKEMEEGLKKLGKILYRYCQ